VNSSQLYRFHGSNKSLQATPDGRLSFISRQASGAPEFQR